MHASRFSLGRSSLYRLTGTPAGRRDDLRLATQDVVDGLALWPLWIRLGWNDILQRYRRSVLGPFWLTVSMAVMVVALGVVYAQIFKIAVRDFVPFLCVGLIVWGYISALLTEAGALFTGSESYIKQIRLPYSLYVCRFVWSKAIILAHNFVIYFGIVSYFQIWPGSVGLCAIPGFLIVTLNGALTSSYLGIVSARFRDIPQIVASVVQIVFFVTPIMWKPELLGARSHLMAWNPFHHLIEIVRAPLLGQMPSLENYAAVGVITAANALVAAALFCRYRARIAYWL
ncbi:MAG: ABC transporter permease [Myxococcota bacterium]